MCHEVTTGKVKYYCDNRGVIANVFSNTLPGISPFLNTDYDLVLVAKTLLHLIPVSVAAEWVKGHYTGKDKEFKHTLNDTADKLATKFNRHPHPRFRPCHIPIAPPGYKIRLLHDNSVITSKLYSILSQGLHRQNLRNHILKKTNGLLTYSPSSIGRHMKWPSNDSLCHKNASRLNSFMG